MNLRTDYPAIFSALEYARTHPDCKPHEWVLEVKQLIDSHALVDEALEEMAKAVETIAERTRKLEQERDLATAKLATARKCERCDGEGEYSIDNLGGSETHSCDACHGTGVSYSDERARELLERLKRAEEDSELLDAVLTNRWVVVGPDPSGTFFIRTETSAPVGRGKSRLEAIRSALAKEGADE